MNVVQSSRYGNAQLFPVLRRILGEAWVHCISVDTVEFVETTVRLIAIRIYKLSPRRALSLLHLCGYCRVRRDDCALI